MGLFHPDHHIRVQLQLHRDYAVAQGFAGHLGVDTSEQDKGAAASQLDIYRARAAKQRSE